MATTIDLAAKKKAAEDAMAELLNAARNGEFYEFAEECTNYEHFDDENSWFV